MTVTISGSTGISLPAESLVGSSSGAVTVQPAAAAGTWSLTLPTTPGTSGQFLRTDGTGISSWVTPSGGGNVSNSGTPVSGQLASWISSTSIQGFAPSAVGDVPFSADGSTFASTQKIVRGTNVATTSGTSIDFTGIPSWVKRITIMINAVSTNGTSLVIFQLGSTTFTTTGYVGYANSWTGPTPTAITNGLGTTTNNAAVDGRQGTMTITNITGNTWIGQGNFMLTTSTNGGVSVGNVTLSGVLDRVRLTTVNGTDTFDAGNINLLWE